MSEMFQVLEKNSEQPCFFILRKQTMTNIKLRGSQCDASKDVVEGGDYKEELAGSDEIAIKVPFPCQSKNLWKGGEKLHKRQTVIPQSYGRGESHHR